MNAPPKAELKERRECRCAANHTAPLKKKKLGQRWNKPVKKKHSEKPSASSKREGEWRGGGQARTYRKIKALPPTGCKSPIGYGEGALEQPKPSPLVGYKKTHDLPAGGHWILILTQTPNLHKVRLGERQRSSRWQSVRKPSASSRREEEWRSGGEQENFVKS